MGGVANPTGPVAEYKFGGYGEYTISATGKCKDCGKSYTLDAVQVKVERQQILASFALSPDRATFAVKSSTR